VLSTGLDGIPEQSQAVKIAETLGFIPFTDDKKKDRELRILNAYDIEVCCVGGPCALPGASEGRSE
jgi:hypothetical protein